MRRAPGVLVAALLVVAPAAPPAPAPAAATTAAPVSSGLSARSAASSYSADAVRATNVARAQHDRKATKADRCLHRYAVRQVKAMIKAGQLFHSDLGKVMAGCDLVGAGENVAYGFPDGSSVVWDGWMRSAGHRANILRGSYRIVGVAARRDQQGTWYAAQLLGRR